MSIVNPSQFKVQPSGPVYHGSPHGFAAGDKIEPKHDGVWLKSGEKAAFGTTMMEEAATYANGHVFAKEGQGRLFGSVYEVAPNSQYERHPMETSGNFFGSPAEENVMPIDREGFTVQKHAAWVYPSPKGKLGPPTIQETPNG